MAQRCHSCGYPITRVDLYQAPFQKHCDLSATEATPSGRSASEAVPILVGARRRCVFSQSRIETAAESASAGAEWGRRTRGSEEGSPPLCPCPTTEQWS